MIFCLTTRSGLESIAKIRDKITAIIARIMTAKIVRLITGLTLRLATRRDFLFFGVAITTYYHKNFNMVI